MVKPTRFVPIALGLLILLGAVLSSACPAREGGDRPPIIISSGSVDLDVSPGTWSKESGNHFTQRDSKGKSVRSFSASTGSCTVRGEKLMVVYGSNSITFVPKSSREGQNDADVEFSSGAVVSQRSPSVLRVDTTDPLVSVSNGGSGPGDSCAVVDARITIRQVQ